MLSASILILTAFIIWALLLVLRGSVRLNIQRA
jgi:hypothetical protein